MTYNASVNAPSPAPLVVVVNAQAGAGRAGARWPALARELTRVGLIFESAFTQGPGDAMRLAEEAARSGRTVVAVGGDGTINEVVNGLMASRAAGAPPPTLGVIPTGTAQDFARSAGIPLAARAAIALLAHTAPRPMDVGRIRFDSGAVRYFANYAGAGFDAMVTAQAKTWGHRLRGAWAYVVGFFAVLRGYENKHFVLRPDGGPRLEPPRRTNMVIVANGGNYAGLLRIAPAASLDDGLLDIVIIGDVGRLELMAYLPLALFGRHLEHPKVTTLRTRSIAVAAGEPLLVQCDGEVAGELPAEFDVIPGAILVLRA
jgi:YegS/Rv2252/BmrU family lipid kinase